MILKFSGKIVDVFKREIYPGSIYIKNKKIARIERDERVNLTHYIMPGFIDSHVHIESSMLTPQHFAEVAVSHGTVAVVSDPHEIANVLGLEGVEFMIRNAAISKMKFFFGVPSCVPATEFETSGGSITAADIEILFKNYDLPLLSEVMNFPGVINGNQQILKKIEIAKSFGKRIDGHAPGLNGKDLDKYIASGIETDHECNSYEEAVEKIAKGMKIIIREGSAAKNFNALAKLINEFPEKVFLCTDDLHPHDLMQGHIGLLVKRGLILKLDFFNLIRAVSLNPVLHYGLNVGLLRENDPADFIIVGDLANFPVIETYIDGKSVFKNGDKTNTRHSVKKPNKFKISRIEPSSLRVHDKSQLVKVIEAFNGELITGKSEALLPTENGFLMPDPNIDVIKIVVVNRYAKQDPAVAFIRNFGLKTGAIASSVAHDSHNIIAVGMNDTDIAECVNWICKNKGGISVCSGGSVTGLALPIAGIISTENAQVVSETYMEMTAKAKSLGCKIDEPFMTLSFMGLLVIPKLKLSDKGLFDVEKFEFTSLYV